MYQVNSTLAILLPFLITFIDELGEMGTITKEKVILILGGMTIVYLIWNAKRTAVNSSKQTTNIKIHLNFLKNIKIIMNIFSII